MTIHTLLLRPFFIVGLLILLIGCQSRHTRSDEGNKPVSQAGQSPGKPSKSTPAPPSGSVHLFLDNSFSMNGYLGNNQYKATLTKLVFGSTTDFGSMTFKPFAVNNTLHPLPYSAPMAFIKSIDPKSKAWTKGEIFTSDIIQIFENVLLKTTPSDISILVSDCIYASETFNLAKEGIEGVFGLALKKKPLKTAIYQMESDYTGMFVFPNNEKKFLSNSIKRPYYVWIIGQPTLVDKFIKALDPVSWPGYVNTYVLGSQQEERFYQVTELESSGRYEVHSKVAIDGWQLRDKAPQFSIAADLPLVHGTSYLEDLQNYVTKAPFSVIKVIPLMKYNFNKGSIGANQRMSLASTTASHLLVIKSNQVFPDAQYTIKLVSRPPAWIAKSNTLDPIESIQPLKTYGLGPLLDGVTAAYKRHSAAALATFTVNLAKD